MANTTIQLKFSTVTSAPTSLNVAEPAYSYVSNTLFIGTPGSDGAIAIGGQYYVNQQGIIYNTANAAFAAANSAGTSAFANAAFDQANAAFSAANTADAKAVSAGSYANSAFAAANTADDKAVSAGSYANSAFAAANTADAKAVTSGSYANSAFEVANSAAIAANTPSHVANSASSYANSAYARANNTVNANTGGTITGSLTISGGDLSVTGNLIVSGNTITQNVTTLNIADPLIYLAANNYSSDTVEIGFAANYYDGSTQRHTGLFREASNKEYYVFENYDKEPDANLIDIDDPSFRVATLNANVKSTVITVKGIDLLPYVNNAYTAANTADAKATSAGSYANSAFAAANTADEKAVSAGSYANSAFSAANTADGKAVSAGSYANSAFGVANTADDKATSAGNYANSAFAKANTDVTGISVTAGDYGTVTGGFAYVPGFKLEANGRISQANSTLLQVDASMITSGVFGVARGGTGANTFTNNGVLLGQGTSAFTTASSSTEGHVLTINASGVPTFAHLSGGTF
jgi:hypothetical protein